LAEPILASLPEPFRSVLLSMYAGEPQTGTDGEKHPIEPATGISPAEGMWIYHLCRQIKPQASLEIGLAFGFSTLFFLAALAENGSGRHTAVDPYQLQAPTRWAGIGLAHGRQLGGEQFRFIEERSFAALAHLSRVPEFFDFLFVDGRHFFDIALTEFTLGAELCSMGGYIAFHDMWLPAIQRAVEFVRANRADFEFVETPLDNIALFRRIATDDRQFKHFVDFRQPGV